MRLHLEELIVLQRMIGLGKHHDSTNFCFVLCVCFFMDRIETLCWMARRIIFGFMNEQVTKLAQCLDCLLVYEFVIQEVRFVMQYFTIPTLM